jgi:hypothetical protein
MGFVDDACDLTIAVKPAFDITHLGDLEQVSIHHR